jgi:hypothetical protein
LRFFLNVRVVFKQIVTLEVKIYNSVDCCRRRN